MLKSLLSCSTEDFSIFPIFTVVSIIDKTHHTFITMYYIEMKPYKYN